LLTLLSVWLAGAPAAANPAAFALTAPDTTELGSSVTGGDFDGDGFSDVAVGALTDEVVGSPEVFVFAGGWGGPSPTPYLGERVGVGPGDPPALAAGDVNGDGYDDLLVGTPTGSTCCGLVEVHLGSRSGVSPTAATVLAGFGGADRFGTAIATGDVNRDGYDDVVVGATYAEGQATGAAYVFLGSAAGLATTPATSLYGAESFEGFGTWVSSGYDVDSDGFDDVLITAPDAVDGRGRVLLFRGTPGGVDPTRRSSGRRWPTATGGRGSGSRCRRARRAARSARSRRW
jgi:hypothetical protein